MHRAPGIAHLGGLGEPERGTVQIGSDAGRSVAIDEAQIDRRIGLAALGRRLVVLHRTGHVLVDADAVVIDVAQIVVAVGVSRSGRLLEKRQGARRVAFIQQHGSQIVVGEGVAERRGLQKPVDRLIPVGLDDLTVAIGPTEIGHGEAVAVGSGHLERLECRGEIDRQAATGELEEAQAIDRLPMASSAARR